jgi:hypothetical protein
MHRSSAAGKAAKSGRGGALQPLSADDRPDSCRLTNHIGVSVVRGDAKERALSPRFNHGIKLEFYGAKIARFRLASKVD